MKVLRNLGIAGATVFVLLQLVRPTIPSGPATAEIQAPPQVLHILDKDCYSCHSEQRKLSWFDEIAPGYWLVRHDILTAREHLNFSQLGSEPEAKQRATLFEAVNMIQLGAMPLPSFTALHPDSKVTPAELTALKLYLLPWSSSPLPQTGVNGNAMSAPGPTTLAAVPPEFNGLAFPADFKSWKLISFTDRGDNNTFRLILGNEIAVKAAHSGNISPWPDGASLAKIAWQQELGPDALIHPGKFVQVEFMVKNARLYKQTAGWAWGRWRGLNLKPYGEDSQFVNECTSCHRPLRNADDVYSLPITTAESRQPEVVNNQAAALPRDLPFQPLDWSPITMYVDRSAHTFSALFGNTSAMSALQSRQEGTTHAAYPPGSVLALITWTQRDDPHWFGARIPSSTRSVELVQIGPRRTAENYQSFDMTTQGEQRTPADIAEERKHVILSLAPVQIP